MKNKNTHTSTDRQQLADNALSILKVHLNSAYTQHPPAVHLFSLRVAPILEYLHVIEEQANDVVCLV